MVEFYDYEGLGNIIDPESDTKQVFIPSPPTMTTVKTNPRPTILYVTGGKIVEGYEKLEELKAYAEENKVVFVCPSSKDPEEVAETYNYIQSKYKVLNVKRDEITVMGDADTMDDAQAVVDYLVDECDADIEDAEEFSF